MSDIWMIAYERACDEFASSGDEEEFRSSLAALGLDPHEIEEEIASATS